jgi:hypothetical protein
MLLSNELPLTDIVDIIFQAKKKLKMMYYQLLLWKKINPEVSRLIRHGS